MSISVPTSLPSGVPSVDPSREPANIRNGGPAAQKAFQVGLAFEQMLVGELSQQLTATTGGADGSSDGSTDGTSDSSSGIMGSDPASSMYGQLIPQAFSSSVMSAGGLGVAAQIAASIDPALHTTGKAS